MSSNIYEQVSKVNLSVYGVGWSLILAGFISGTCLFYKHRHHPLIKNRSFPWVLTQQASFVVLTTANTSLFLFYTPLYPCVLWQIPSMVSGFLLILSIAARQSSLFFKHNLAKQKIEECDSRRLDRKNLALGWILKNWKLINSFKFKTSLGLLVVTLIAFPVLVGILSYPQIVLISLWNPMCMQAGRLVVATSGFILAIIFIFNLVIIFLSRSIDENFHIKSEIKLISYVFVYEILVIIQNYFWAWLDFQKESKGKFHGFVLFMFVLPNLFLLWTSYFRTLLLIYRFDFERQRTTDASKTMNPQESTLYSEFEFMIHHEQGIQIFKEQLIKEFSVEGLLFWIEAKDFGSLNRDDKENLYIRAKEIFERYIDESTAIIPINISATERFKLDSWFKQDSNHATTTSRNHQQILSEFPSDLFEGAEKEIYLLLFADSFFRFRQTESYRVFFRNNFK
jgi:hypothetical protein